MRSRTCVRAARSSGALGALALAILAGCGGGGGSSGTSPPPPPPPPPFNIGGFTWLTDTQWNELAVRKVLRTFAYGGQASDAQIRSWADMAPGTAIREMLTLDEHNLKLSPTVPSDTDSLSTRRGTLRGLADFWSSNDAANTVDPGLRELQKQPTFTFIRAAMSRGLNPFRQKIGYFETGYHMAVNLRTGVTGDQVIRFYDEVMTAHANGLAYQQVLATGAASAAIARQYGHFQNVFIGGVCFCNEDFAREYHQLLFGILGKDDPAYHETVSVKNTAKVLTDLRLRFDPVTNDFVDALEFGTTAHAPGPLEVLRAQVNGGDAKAKISALADVAITQPESLDNLPVIIVRTLADDELDVDELAQIRAAWRSMQPKNLLDFVRAYAISTAFHSTKRVKRWTSLERNLLIANQVSLSNRDVNTELYTPYTLLDEDVTPFAPRHNVFGDQTGAEALDSAGVFRVNFNRATAEWWHNALPNLDTSAVGAWEKDWSTVAPRSAGGGYVVRDLAEWLWQRFVGDDLASFGPLERANVYAWLTFGTDLVYLVERDRLQRAGLDVANLALYDFSRTITAADVQNDAQIKAVVDSLATQTLRLASSETQANRREANARVGLAVDFIVATPFMFVERGI